MNERPELLPNENPVIPEGINVSSHHPLRELGLLTAGAIGLFIVLSVVVWSILTFGARYIPMSWETRLSQSIENLLETDLPDSQIQIDLQSRLDRIVQQIDEQNTFQLTAHYIDSDVVNAFATLGGHVFVFSGLLDVIETDVGLDMVLAHEAAHVLNRDPIQAAAGTVGLQLLMALVTGNGDFAQTSGLMNMGSNMLLLSYSREQERAADERALEALKALYEDLTGADELFVFIQNSEGERAFPEFFSSHPNPSARIANIQKAINSD